MQYEQAVLDEMERKLCVIADFMEDDEVTCDIIPASEEFDLPSLMIRLPEDDHGLPRILLMNYVPFPEASESTDFIQFYIELPYDLSAYDEPSLYKAIDELNRQLPLGHCMTLSPRPDLPYEKMVSMRYIYALSNERELDEGNLLEALMLFLLSCDAVEMRFLAYYTA